MLKDIEVFVSGGVVQYVKIPKELNVKVLVRDYDLNIDPESEEAKQFNIKQDIDGNYYEEGIWE